MSKSRLYSKLKEDWRQWDDDVYCLALSMLAGFKAVADNPEADPSLVAEIQHVRHEVEQFEIWTGKSTKAG